MSELVYLGLHGNTHLCANASCLDLVHSNWPALRMVSISGGRPVHPAWCSVAAPSAPKAYVMYVGATPAFDDCMHSICLSREPSTFLVGYLSSIHVASAVAGTLAIEDRELEEIVMAGKVQIGDAMAIIIAASDRGWIVGDGGTRDPCIDPARFTTVIASFSAFGVLLLLVALDGLLLGTGQDLLRRCRPRGWWVGPPLHQKQRKQQGSKSRATELILAVWTMRYSLAIVADVTFDAIVLVQIIPLMVRLRLPWPTVPALPCDWRAGPTLRIMLSGSATGMPAARTSCLCALGYIPAG
jgi:hypothetical protein